MAVCLNAVDTYIMLATATFYTTGDCGFLLLLAVIVKIGIVLKCEQKAVQEIIISTL